MTGDRRTPAERPVGPVRGTRDWLPPDYARLARLERRLLDGFAGAGYIPLRTPVLELTELHERKSGAGIVAKLFELPGGSCLRPELTAGIVRAYAEAPECPPLPWRVCMSGQVFRFQPPRPGRDREFTQVGVEMLGAGGPDADAEIIALAHDTLRALGIDRATIRVGHVGLILEMLGRSGLPPAATEALVQMLSEAASDGGDVRALESAVDQFAGWLDSRRDADADADEIATTVGRADDRGVDRLFRHLVPDVTGRRSGHEIIHRLRRKWDLGRSLHEALGRVRGQISSLSGLRGALPEVLKRLGAEYAELAPESVRGLNELAVALERRGIDPARVELDLGFGRGIGFYTQMIFEILVDTPDGPTDVCGGGRYDGLASVLGSDRDARGAGFAFGLERLDGVLAHAGRPRS